MKISFLVSGGGGNLKFLHESLLQGFIKNVELSVVADRECDALRFARENSVDSYLIEFSRSNPESLRETLYSIDPDVVVSSWNKIIDVDTVKAFETKLINLHYSLLPAFGSLIGVAPIKQAYEKGCRYIGPSCHYVDEGVDTGQIIAQAIFKTDISYQEAVSTMFQTGCITLLNAITQITNEDILGEAIRTSDQNYDNYNPALNFNLARFDIYFWNKLTNL